MIIKAIIRYFFIIIPSILVFSCANQSSPTGGPKDEEPPVLESSLPKQGQLNYKGKIIELTFNELIHLNNPKEQILITPRIDHEIDFKYRKNKVIIQFNEPLSDSTTYTISFREGIQDITENNSTNNLKLAFSTGNYLDSLSITGKINFLQANKPGKDFTVSLYELEDTLDVFNSPPIYLTKANDKGQFAFDNLKNGKYKLYALNDKNRNSILDSKTESYGFISDTIDLHNNIDSLNIYAINMDVRALEFQNARQAGTVFTVKYNKSLTDYDLKSTDTTNTLYSNFTDDTNNTIQIYNTFSIQDSLQTFIQSYDSANNHLTDTIYVKFEKTIRSPSPFTQQIELSKITLPRPVFKSTLSFNKPIKHINYDSVYLFLDSTNVIHFDSTQLEFNKTNDQISLTYPLDPQLFKSSDKTANPSPEKPLASIQPDTLSTSKKAPQKPHFYLGKAAFISIENDSTKAFKNELAFSKPEQLSTILVQVITAEPNYIIQLLNTQYEIIQQSINNPDIRFDYLQPGTYLIRAIIDLKANQVWDPGNIQKNIEPEKILYYLDSEKNDKLNVKANWELGPNILRF